MVNVGPVPKGAKLTLDGKEVTADADGHVPTTPGSHDVELTLSGGATASTNVDLKRGTVTRLALSPQAPTASRILPWIATGTAAALVTAGAVLLVNAQSRRSQLQTAAALREPGTDLPATDYKDLQTIDAERRTFTTVGFGLLIAGGGTAILATTLWLIPSGSSHPSTAPKTARLAPTIAPIVGPGMLGVSGSF
jgi:hypothetical protein